MECYKQSSAVGSPLSLKVFIAGRNRLENDGATALAQAFQVMGYTLASLLAELHGRQPVIGVRILEAFPSLLLPVTRC